jgi:acetolactate synthase regulatory subunit
MTALPAPSDADTLALTVSTRPTTHALAQLLAVLHSRGARVAQLSWRTDPASGWATVTLVAALTRTRHDHLRAAIARLVDVVAVGSDVVPPAELC